MANSTECGKKCAGEDHRKVINPASFEAGFFNNKPKDILTVLLLL
jgi:hypothetical protein